MDNVGQARAEHGLDGGCRLGVMGLEMDMLKLRPKLLLAIELRLGSGKLVLLLRDLWHPVGVLQHINPEAVLLTGLLVDARLMEVVTDDRWQWPGEMRAELAKLGENLPPIFGGPT
ncbi:hypothetical protein Salat_0564200 [Sesamum alatum]|uniref:Uncharacterized protein n=1 Tax=Sesamum alatum TaxID=300844 RepID=A0AAE2CTJ9_9LAMI|nr:hypothetical protein Salat_0564200 [Sesamum alatum]